MSLSVDWRVVLLGVSQRCCVIFLGLCRCSQGIVGRRRWRRLCCRLSSAISQLVGKPVVLTRQLVPASPNSGWSHRREDMGRYRLPAGMAHVLILLVTLSSVAFVAGSTGVAGDRSSSKPMSVAETKLRAAMTDRTNRYVLRTNVKLTRSLPLVKKDFTLVGDCGRKRCVIDGQKKYRGIVAENHLTLSNVELARMRTVEVGTDDYSYGDNGGAVFVDNGELTVKRCVFRGNVAAKGNGGGAVALLDSPYDIQDSEFIENYAEGSGGAFQVFSNSFGNVTRTTFSKNRARMHGGAAFFRESTVDFVSCTFSGNRAGQNGGALLLSESGAAIARTTFSSNSAPRGYGGAIRAILDGTNVAICSSTKFVKNSAKYKSTSNVSVDQEGGKLTYCPKPPKKGPAACSVCK